MKRRNDPYQGGGERQLRGNHPEQFGRSLEDNLIALRRLFADSKEDEARLIKFLCELDEERKADK